MPFDPNIPGDTDPVVAPPLRAQFNALKQMYDTLAAQFAALQAQFNNLQANVNNQIAGTALNPNGQFGNFDPNWQPSGDPNTDFFYIRDRLTDFYNITAR